MTNLEKLGRLYAYFVSCDWGHNNNDLKITAADNGIGIEIYFEYYNASQLNVDFKYKYSDDNFSIQFRKDNILDAFTYDFDKLDELLTKIFTEVIKTPVESLSLDSSVNSNI